MTRNEPTTGPAADLAKSSHRSQQRDCGHPVSRSLVIVSGSPGSGKSSVAAELMSRLDSGVHVEGDLFWTMLGDNFIEPWLPGANDQNRAVIEAMTLAAAAFARGGYLPVLDFVIGPWHLDVVQESCRLANVGCHFIVLRPTAITTITRAASRTDSSTESGPVRQMIKAFSDLGPLSDHAIDTTSQTVAETAEDVERAIESGRFLLGLGR